MLHQVHYLDFGGPTSKEREGGKGRREGKEEDKGGQEKGGEGEEGKRGREGKEGEGKTLWICSPRKNFLATPLLITD